MDHFTSIHQRKKDMEETVILHRTESNPPKESFMNVQDSIWY